MFFNEPHTESCDACMAEFIKEFERTHHIESPELRQLREEITSKLKQVKACLGIYRGITQAQVKKEGKEEIGYRANRILITAGAAMLVGGGFVEECDIFLESEHRIGGAKQVRSLCKRLGLKLADYFPETVSEDSWKFFR